MRLEQSCGPETVYVLSLLWEYWSCPNSVSFHGTAHHIRLEENLGVDFYTSYKMHMFIWIKTFCSQLIRQKSMLLEFYLTGQLNSTCWFTVFFLGRKRSIFKFSWKIMLFCPVILMFFFKRTFLGLQILTHMFLLQ